MCRSFFTLLALALAAALLNACASRHTAAALNDVESYIQERPDSALATLRAIDTTTLTTRKLRAQHALLHAIALDKNWIDTADVNVVMPAVAYYDRHPSGIRRAKAWYYLGRILENNKDFAPAGIAFLKAEKYSEQTNDLRFKSLVYQSLSNNYNETHLYEEALRYTTLSYELSVQDGDTLGANASLYRMAQDFNNVMVHFRDSFPDKKPQNYQLVSFLFAGFDSSTICAAIPGFKKQNVHVEKYRLKQMIKDSDSQYKEQFLELLS